MKALTGFGLQLLGMIGIPTLLVLWLAGKTFRRLRPGLGDTVRVVRDVTVLSVAAAGLSRLLLGPRWRRWLVTVTVGAGWLVAWRTVPHLRVMLAVVVPVTAGTAVWAAAWYYAWRFGLWDLRVDHVLIEGHRLNAEAVAASRSVGAAVGKAQDRHPRIRDRSQDPVDGCSLFKLEPPPGKTLEALRRAVHTGALDSGFVASLRRDGVAGRDESVTVREVSVDDGCVWVKVIYGQPDDPDDGLDDVVTLDDLEAYS